MILIISYDLSLVANHSAFFETLKQQGLWWHYLTSTWLVSTNKTPDQVYNALVPTMVQADRLLIFELGRAHQGYLPKEAWDWITQQQTMPTQLAPPIPMNLFSLTPPMSQDELNKAL